MHKGSGAHKFPYNQVHNLLLTWENLDENVKTKRRENYSYMLYLTEVLTIQSEDSVLNLQHTGNFRFLKITSH